MILAIDVDPVSQLVLNPGVVIAFFTLITAGLGIVSGLVVRNGHKTKQNAATTDEIRKAVVNSHSVNLRDDLDEKFDGLAGLVKELASRVEQGFTHVAVETMEIRKEVGGVRHEARELRANLETERNRIRDLEDTRPASPKTAIARPARRKSPATRTPRTS
jgi:uncharacterized membrane-anchored protein YhcB (DUF1043 family)